MEYQWDVALIEAASAVADRFAKEGVKLSDDDSNRIIEFLGSLLSEKIGEP